MTILQHLIPIRNKCLDNSNFQNENYQNAYDKLKYVTDFLNVKTLNICKYKLDKSIINLINLINLDNPTPNLLIP